MKYEIYMIGCRKDDPLFMYGSITGGTRADMYMHALRGDSLSDFNINDIIEAYENVAFCVADSLDNVFQMMNVWNENEKHLIHVYDNYACRSLSVGDLILDDSGHLFVVANHGFDEIDLSL